MRSDAFQSTRIGSSGQTHGRIQPDAINTSFLRITCIFWFAWFWPALYFSLSPIPSFRFFCLINFSLAGHLVGFIFVGKVFRNTFRIAKISAVRSLADICFLHVLIWLITCVILSVCVSVFLVLSILHTVI